MLSVYTLLYFQSTISAVWSSLLQCFKTLVFRPAENSSHYPPQVFELEEAINELTTLIDIFLSLTGALAAQQDNVSDLDGSGVLADNLNFVTIIPESGNLRRHQPPPLSFCISALTFSLVYIESVRGIFYRAKLSSNWFGLNYQSSTSTQMEELSLFPLIEGNSNWSFLLYESIQPELLTSTVSDVFQSINGQSAVSCTYHDRLLSCDFPKNGYICHYKRFVVALFL